MDKPVKSIFRQREVENMYCLKKIPHFIYPYNDDIYIDKCDGEIISDKIIREYDVDMPLLEKGDKFYLSDINQTVVIKERMRGSDGSVVYFLNDKYVDTENSKAEMEECNQKIANAYSQKKEFEKYKKEYKYKHRFFNFGSDKAPNDRN